MDLTMDQNYWCIVFVHYIYYYIEEVEPIYMNYYMYIHYYSIMIDLNHLDHIVLSYLLFNLNIDIDLKYMQSNPLHYHTSNCTVKDVRIKAIPLGNLLLIKQNKDLV